MAMIVGIKFDNSNDLLYFNSNNLKLKRKLTVIVDTERGLEFGTVMLVPFSSDDKRYSNLRGVVRIATRNDYLKHKKNINDSNEAFRICKDLILEYNLNMTLVDCHYTFDRNQLIFRFLSDSRIDFRDLARHLASIYKTRIELRQIGARDKAREIGGCGLCGRTLCCSSFLNDLDTVSINMAKNQNIALNPSKINGLCGRLMCCLKYEDSCYKECRKGLPSIGDFVNTDSGGGNVVSVDVLNRKYSVLVNGSVIEVSCGSN